MASITKMYTFFACLEINQMLNVHIDKIYIKILNFNTQGTSADLSIGQYIKLRDLYYGLMLPSGNDAASNLAFYYGYWLDKK
jgi:serine-type D-Ala-D-Ala carboxypeptidase (penicillin-binding protein 5/6)